MSLYESRYDNVVVGVEGVDVEFVGVEGEVKLFPQIPANHWDAHGQR